MRLLFHLAGDWTELSAREVEATFEAHDRPLTVLRREGPFLDAHANVFEDEVRPIVGRLGLAHVAASHVFDGVPGEWSEGARDCCLLEGVTFAVRKVAVHPEVPWSSPAVEREVGALLAAGRKVDLERPHLLIRAFLTKERVYVGRQVWESDPKQLRQRHVDNRPHSSPVSLEPRLARALVNLSRVRPHDVLYDPFCGTGGVLLEAAGVGARVVGSDVDPAMVAGTRTNLAHYGAKDPVVFESDVGSARDRLSDHGFDLVDAVVADLPYGRSSSTAREPVVRLHERGLAAIASFLKPGGWAVVGLPGELPNVPANLTPVEVHRVRAHRSLTRHFHVLRRSGLRDASPASGRTPASPRF